MIRGREANQAHDVPLLCTGARHMCQPLVASPRLHHCHASRQGTFNFRLEIMIARIWHGITKADDLANYTEFMKSVAMPDYSNTEGFIKGSFLRRIEGDEAHFTLITYWENLQSIKNFAGEDYEIAKYYPEDKDYLLKFEKKVKHFEVFADE